MLILTNMASQEVAPGQVIIFNATVLHTGKWECYREGSGSVGLRAQNAIYEINFSADIGATEVGVAELSIAVGAPFAYLPETTMTSTTAVAGNLNNVAKTTAVKTCCGSSEFVAIVNTGTTTVTVENPSLYIKRTA